ncbi:DUF4384 domain-containing protein [Roseibium denhamense]|uniref:Peptidase C14 caspase domain-containing protein n=2 Tax=Roseibium denhamense TaxID=76305 RepID=A0ABY1NRP6_9HYPH|nr:caspase family protein [Roseibium denhamense]MTI08045.1 DUF4384 domain-containing protein [Roseibium denhamense]SMP15899.1 protein of unknown function [Roseibium denhamense]
MNAATRHWVSRLVRLSASLAMALWITAGPARAAEWRGLVIGIDAYENVGPLQGAVNDAKDIAATLSAAGVEDITTLYDGAATRNAVLTAWQDLIERSGPDDVLVLSYAGHGAQEAEWQAGSEQDGLDEVFLLAGFGMSAPQNGERIRDDDLNRMLAAAANRSVLVLADSCHSGTMTRSIDPRITRLGTRIVGLPPIEDDVLRSAPVHPVLASSGEGLPEAQDMPNVVYVGATVDGQVIPELVIGGEPRGALSWAFARGVEGRADLDRDGGISMEELSLFLKETVRVATEGRQTPSLTIGGGSRSAVLPKAETDLFADGSPVLTISASTAEAGPVLSRLAQSHSDRLQHVEDSQSDLFWDVETADVLTRFGDVVLEGRARTADDFAGVVTKWLLLAELYSLARDLPPIEGEVRPSVGHIREGSALSVGLTPAQDGYMAVIALEADGSLRVLAPDKGADPLGRDTKAIAGKAYGLNLKAGQPFGADHVLLIQSEKPMTALLSVLTALQGKPLDPVLLPRISDLIAKSASGLGVAAVYTQPAG